MDHRAFLAHSGFRRGFGSCSAAAKKHLLHKDFTDPICHQKQALHGVLTLKQAGLKQLAGLNLEKLIQPTVILSE